MSQQISAQQVNQLRQQTGAGLMDCKKALTEANGNIEEAITILKKKGIASAAKKADRAASEGTIQSYIHMGGRVGVLLELNCETDFVAKNEEFKQLAKDLCMHIAAASPQYVKREDVPSELVAKEQEIAKAQTEGKPPAAAEGIIKGKLDKWYKQICLLEQEYVKDSSQTVQEVLNQAIGKMGENMLISRFERYQIGG
ncbi:MAG: translation elongation factor Ts [Verrucomicrobia bacterium]|nr:MAG: translation elongation factor Ts [Verrucomicrobiota bacterium]